MNVLALSALVVVLPVVSVLVADTIEDIRFRGRFYCGCKWPAEEDGPEVVTCPHGSWQFRVWRDWLGRQRDAWDATDEGVDVMDDSFGARLRLARGGVTQARLADLLDVTQTTVSHWENDRRTPSVGHIRRLADVMDVDPGWLAFGDEAETEPSEGETDEH